MAGEMSYNGNQLTGRSDEALIVPIVTLLTWICVNYFDIVAMIEDIGNRIEWSSPSVLEQMRTAATSDGVHGVCMCVCSTPCAMSARPRTFEQWLLIAPRVVSGTANTSRRHEALRLHYPILHTDSR